MHEWNQDAQKHTGTVFARDFEFIVIPRKAVAGAQLKNNKKF